MQAGSGHGCRAAIHARGGKHLPQPQIGAERGQIPRIIRHVDHHLRATALLRAGGQQRAGNLGGGRDQRPHLEPVAAGAQRHKPVDHPAIVMHQRVPAVGVTEPLLVEGGLEIAAGLGFQRAERGAILQPGGADARRLARRQRARQTHGAPRRGKARAGIVLLLRGHAIQRHAARSGMAQRVLPQRMAKAAPAIAAFADIKPQKSHRLIVVHHADGGDHLALILHREKPLRIGLPEGFGIVEPGIPALCRRPVQRGLQLGSCHLTRDHPFSASRRDCGGGGVSRRSSSDSRSSRWPFIKSSASGPSPRASAPSRASWAWVSHMAFGLRQ